MSKVEFCTVYITTPDLKQANKIARHLLKNRLAACANIFKISSSYWWKGEIENCPEYAILLKTKRKLVRKLIKATKKIHPYEVPCIVAWDIVDGNPDFLKWIGEETK